MFFFFMLKALFVLGTFYFVLIIGYMEKMLDKKAIANFTFMMSQTRQEMITINILPNYPIS